MFTTFMNRIPVLLASRLVCILHFLFLINVGFAQITSGNIDPEKETEKIKEKKIKEEKEPLLDSLQGNSFYLSGMGQYTYRTLQDLTATKVYSDWEKQQPIFTGATNIGLIMKMSNHFSVDIGLSYFGAGEQYTFNDSISDSSFYYKNTYRQLALPLKVRYSTGDKFQFFAFAGIAPLNILNIRYKSNFVRENGAEVDVELQIKKDQFSAFNVMATVGFGINYNLKYIGFTLYPEFRRNLLNTYPNNVLALKHNLYSFGVNAGFLVHF